MKGKGANFKQNWNQYKEGFGAVDEKNFWIGLERLHNITKSGSYGLKIVLKLNSTGEKNVAEYDSFRVTGERDNYRLLVSGFRPEESGLRDMLKVHNGAAFSTYDNDNDELSDFNCASFFGDTGWWFKGCGNTCLNSSNGPWWDSIVEEESTMSLIKK